MMPQHRLSSVGAAPWQIGRPPGAPHGPLRDARALVAVGGPLSCPHALNSVSDRGFGQRAPRAVPSRPPATVVGRWKVAGSAGSGAAGSCCSAVAGSLP